MKARVQLEYLYI